MSVGTKQSPPEADPSAPTNYVTGIADGNLTTPVRLLDYLTGVGVVFRLPKRNRKKELAEAAAKVEASRIKVRIPVRKLMMLVAPVVLGLVGYWAWDNFLANEPLPSGVSGTWSTNDGRYAGRTFWLNSKAVAFQNGNKADQFSVHPVKRVQTKQVADTLFLSIEYEQEGQPVTLSLAYRDLPSPQVRLVNQPHVHWFRSGNAPVISQ